MSKANQSGLIICKYQKLEIADNFLLEAVTTHPTAAGFAVAINGQVIIKTFDPAEHDLLDALQKTQKQYLDHQVYFHLSNADEDSFDEVSMQPIPLVQKNNEILLAAMAEGEFQSYANGGETTPESLMIREYLLEKVKGVYMNAGQNMEKTRLELEKTTFRNDLRHLLLPRGVILMIPNKGKAFAYTENKLFGNYDWGFATKTLGIPSTVKEPGVADKEATETPAVAPVDPNKKLTLREKAARKAALEASTATAGVVAAPSQTPVIASVTPITAGNAGSTDKKPDQTVNIKKNEEGVDWVYPPEGASYNEAKQWWNRNTTLKRPKDEELYKGFPAAALSPNSPVKAFLDKQKASTVANAMKKAQENKGDKAKADVDDMLGVQSADDKKAVVRLVQNDVYWNKTPEEITGQIAPHALFSKQNAIDFEKTLNVSTAFYIQLNKKQLISLLHETRLKLIEERQEKVSKKPAAAAELEKPAAPPKKLTLREKAALRAQAAA